jgi:hypothetical protein
MILTLQQEHNIPRARSLPPTVIQAVSMVQKEEERKKHSAGYKHIVGQSKFQKSLTRRRKGAKRPLSNQHKKKTSAYQQNKHNRKTETARRYKEREKKYSTTRLSKAKKRPTKATP